jgi:hypothetical protein
MEKAFQLKMNLMEQKYEGNSDALQKGLVSLKQKKLEQQEENKRLKERLAGMVTEIQDGDNSDPYYGSSNNKNDYNNDINHDSECNEEKEGGNNVTITTQQSKNHHGLVETYAYPNCSSSANEDPRNAIYLD